MKPVSDMDIEEVIFFRLPSVFKNMTEKEVGFAKHMQRVWVKGLSDAQEKYARTLLRRSRIETGPLVYDG